MIPAHPGLSLSLWVLGAALFAASLFLRPSWRSRCLAALGAVLLVWSSYQLGRAMQWVSCATAYTRYVKQVFRDLADQPDAEAKAKMRQLHEDFMFPLEPEAGKER